MDKAYYQDLARGYAELDDKVVMKNVDLQQAILDAIPFAHDAHIRILDLGIGTGVNAQKVLAQFPNATIVGVDFSEDMIAASTTTLAGFIDRITLVQADLSSIGLSNYGEFDAVISAVTIHNLEDFAKEHLFDEIFKVLKVDGIFINGDFVKEESPDEQEKSSLKYREFLTHNLEGQQLNEWLTHAFEKDMPMKLSQQSVILKRVGFKDVKSVWKYFNELVYTATK